MKVNFTRKNLDRLPLPDGSLRHYYYDAKVRGLALGVSSTGRKTFLLYRKIQGRPERVTLGLYPDLSIEQARGKASAMNAAIARGEDPAQQRRAIRGEMTLGDLFAVYLERHSKVYKRSWVEDEEQFRRYLQGWRSRRLSTLRKSDIALLHGRVGKEHGPYAANRLIALLRAMFNRAADWGWEGSNPAIGITKFRERARERFLEADELPRFFRALSEELNTTVRDYVLLSLLTGARRCNVLAMRWEELNLERATWTIPQTKSGEAFTVALSIPALKVLRERQQSATSEWVFPGIGTSGHLVEPKATWKRILRRAGIQDLRLHDLRRTLGSWQAATGASLSIIGKTLAHKNVATTAIYARLNLDPVRQSVNLATSAMFEAAGMLPDGETNRKALPNPEPTPASVTPAVIRQQRGVRHGA
jgi:integrase